MPRAAAMRRPRHELGRRREKCPDLERPLLDRRTVRVLMRPDHHRERRRAGLRRGRSRRAERDPRGALGAGEERQGRWVGRHPRGRVAQALDRVLVDDRPRVPDRDDEGRLGARVDRQRPRFEAGRGAHYCPTVSCPTGLISRVASPAAVATNENDAVGSTVTVATETDWPPTTAGSTVAFWSAPPVPQYWRPPVLPEGVVNTIWYSPGETRFAYSRSSDWGGLEPAGNAPLTPTIPTTPAGQADGLGSTVQSVVPGSRSNAPDTKVSGGVIGGCGGGSPVGGSVGSVVLLCLTGLAPTEKVWAGVGVWPGA